MLETIMICVASLAIGAVVTMTALICMFGKRGWFK